MTTVVEVAEDHPMFWDEASDAMVKGYVVRRRAWPEGEVVTWVGDGFRCGHRGAGPVDWIADDWQVLEMVN